MTTFLTIGQAAKQTGKSTSTIRRFVKSVVDDPQHADRCDIEPTPDDVRRFKENEVQFSWKVSEALLTREFDDQSATEQGSGTGDPAASIHAEKTLDLLQSTVVTMQEQLAAKDGQIKDLNERLRESNIMHHELQRKLSLSAGADTATDAVEVPDTDATESKPKKTSAKSSKARPKKAPKRRLFGGLFQR